MAEYDAPLTEAEGAAIGRDLLVCAKLASALERRLRVVYSRVAKNNTDAAYAIRSLALHHREQARELGRALEWRLDDLSEVAQWITQNVGGWDDDLIDAEELSGTSPNAADSER